jgi:signal-transduction protein with cAMP-binding, CBS, and nucleotidyltransferase domain
MNVFNEAIDSHANWKMLLKRHIDLGKVLDIREVANSHICELGKWIYGEGLQFNRLPSFEELCSQHDHFHRAAAEVVKHSNAGQKDKALSLIKPNGEFSKTSNNLVRALMECSRELAQHVVHYTHSSGKIHDLLRKKKDTVLHSVQDSTKVIDALKSMVDLNIGSLVVYRDQEFLGIFTERGVAHNIVMKGSDFLNSPISEVVDPDVFYINAYDSIDQAMTLMTTTHKRHLPVLEDGKLIGIISIGDVVKHVVGEDKETMLQLKSYIHGSYGATTPT